MIVFIAAAAALAASSGASAPAGRSLDVATPPGVLQGATFAPLGRDSALVSISADQPTKDGYSCSKPTPEQAVIARVDAGRVVAQQTYDESIDRLGLGGGRVAAVSTRAGTVTKECGEGSRLTLSAGTVEEPRAELRVLGDRVRLVASALAVDDRGTIGFTWSELLPGRDENDDLRERLWLTVWPAGGEPQAPRLLGEAPSYEYGGGNAFEGLAIRARPGGGWLIATRQFRRGSFVVLDELRDNGRRTTTKLGAGASLTDISLAASPAGRVAVLWGTQDGGEERNEPYRVRAVLREPGAERFGAARLLDPGGEAIDPSGRPVVRLTEDGTAVAAWDNRPRGGAIRVLMTQARPGAPFAAPRILAARRGFAGLAVGAGGRFTVLTDSDTTVTARLFPGGRALRISPRGAVSIPLGVAYPAGERTALALLEVQRPRRKLGVRLVRVR